MIDTLADVDLNEIEDGDIDISHMPMESLGMEPVDSEYFTHDNYVTQLFKLYDIIKESTPEQAVGRLKVWLTSLLQDNFVFCARELWIRKNFPEVFDSRVADSIPKNLI